MALAKCLAFVNTRFGQYVQDVTELVQMILCVFSE